MSSNGDRPLCATEHFSKGHIESHPEVSALARLLEGTPAEQVTKEVTKMTKDIVKVGAGGLHPALYTLVAKTIVEITFFGITEDFVGLAGFSENLGCFRVVRILIRMMGERNAAKCLFDSPRIGRALHAKNLVVVSFQRLASAAHR